MYRRLIILTIVIVLALCALSGLGYHAVTKWAEGLEGARLGEFAEVAEQIRQDVRRKLDEFLTSEEQRPYTDYLYSYVPDNLAVAQQQLPLLRSPLAGQVSNYLAYGYFQVEPDGTIVSPYYQERAQLQTQGELVDEVESYLANVEENLLPSITSVSGVVALDAVAELKEEAENVALGELLAAGAPDETPENETVAFDRAALGKALPIESLKGRAQQSQVFRQSRAVATSNTAIAPEAQSVRSRAAPQDGLSQLPQAATDAQSGPARQELLSAMQVLSHEAVDADEVAGQQEQVVQAEVVEGEVVGADDSDTVQIRVEPFVPVTVPYPDRRTSVFGNQIFLLRHVQIEDRHLLQGFRLNDSQLVAAVAESAQRFVREGMAFELPQVGRGDGLSEAADEVAYTAILDFGFGGLILHLREIDPAWIARRIDELQHVYLGILIVVTAAVGLALVSLWHNVRAQLKLAQKKDDFISAVSHELRTPLTSIRMYAEMLEKNWVKSADKLAEYYRNMRQESERLSRLVENVLDFSRIQKGRKKYALELGDINAGMAEVVEMMRPYAQQNGFAIQTDFERVGQAAFDKDAVTQIVVNLIDNAVKYAAGAEDKTIFVRTRKRGRFTVIEVEDHGPGIPHRQRAKVFEQFYRCTTEPVRHGVGGNRSQTTGTGLGLALVKRFAEAHGGFVEIRSAQPSGAVMTVGLAAGS